MEKEVNQFTLNRGVQDYLSIGYVYLLVLGIASDSIFYGFLGINILSYSTIVDVLLSPIIYLVSKGIVFSIFIIIIPILSYFLITFNRKRYLKKREKESFRQKNDIEKMDKVFSNEQLSKSLVIVSAFIIFSAYIGFGLGSGGKTKDRIQSGNFTLNHQLVFNDGDIVQVKLIGHNSQYIFYVLENEKQVKVSPIQGNIKSIEKLNK